MFFKEWLENLEELQLNEMPRRGPVPGAFGNRRTHSQMDNRFQGREERVAYGRKIEDQIYNGLKKCGFQLRKPSLTEDTIDKIDAHWNRNGVEEALQIKYRDKDNDILFEVELDARTHKPGRDMKSKSVYYAVYTKPTGKVHIFRVAEIKDIITKMQQTVEFAGFDPRGNFIQNGAKLSMRRDPATNIPKLLAYIPLSRLTPVVEPCAINLNFSV